MTLIGNLKCPANRTENPSWEYHGYLWDCLFWTDVLGLQRFATDLLNFHADRWRLRVDPYFQRIEMDPCGSGRSTCCYVPRLNLHSDPRQHLLNANSICLTPVLLYLHLDLARPYPFHATYPEPQRVDWPLSLAPVLNWDRLFLFSGQRCHRRLRAPRLFVSGFWWSLFSVEVLVSVEAGLHWLFPQAYSAVLRKEIRLGLG